MQQYYQLLEDVLNNGSSRSDRTGTGTLSTFGKQIEFNLKDGFPLLPGKYTSFDAITAELMWFLSGSTNNNKLKAMNKRINPKVVTRDTIWEEWALKSRFAHLDGELGPIYGEQWRDAQVAYNPECEEWAGVDQIKNLLEGLSNNPLSRRHVVSAWGASDLPDEQRSPEENVRNGKMALAPCHCLFQFYVRELSEEEIKKELEVGESEIIKKLRDAVNWVHESELEEIDKRWSEYIKDEMEKIHKGGLTPSEWGIAPRYALSCHMYQRSADLFLGLPYNIASYALLTHIIAHLTNMTPDRLIISLGDAHIYKNHIEQTKELLSRDHTAHALPELIVRSMCDSPDIDDFLEGVDEDTFELINYKSYPYIKAEVSV